MVVQLIQQLCTFATENRAALKPHVDFIGMVYMCGVIVAYRATVLGIHNRVLLIVASNSLVVNENMQGL